MTAPESVTGYVLDGSALAALLTSHTTALVWLRLARTSGAQIIVPDSAVAEATMVYPHQADLLARLLDHPAILTVPAHPEAVAELLDSAGVFDPAAAVVLIAAEGRGFPVITGDAGRLRRIVPDGPEIREL
ncbi:PIN domain-containing protein [Longispora sp. NPDC051575]|uniref:PIN domain-containing protein n=1 Tax=Longispora sp. NPDC051575 TaxID=3154943 RepID=UPI0034356B7F